MLTLVVSGLEKKFIKKDDKLLLAGNWLQNENNINEEVYENNIFISDEKEIKSFTTNISNIHEKIVNKLHIELNKVHNVNFDLRMWKVLIDPWITYYLENIYFRWKIIKDILENDKKNGIKFLNFDKIVYSAPFDQNEFHHLIASSSTFNHFIFQKILIYFSKTNNQLIAENINQKVPLSANYNYTINEKKISKLKKISEIFLGFFSFSNKIYLDINCGIFDYLKLCIHLKQFPFRGNKFSKELYDLQNGVYIIRIVDSRLRFEMIKVMLNK